MTIDEVLSVAVAHEDAGRWTVAESIYSQVVAQMPDCAPAQFRLGVVRQLLGRFEESIEPLRCAATLRPDGAEAWVNLANAYRGAGKMEDALVAADRAIAISPVLPEAHFNRGAVLHMLARFAEAMNAYDRAIALKPDFARAHLNRAILLLLLGDFERGLPEYEWRIPLLPRQAPAGAKALMPSVSSPSPGTPGEGWGEGRAFDTNDPHPSPLPAYREREQESLTSRLKSVTGQRVLVDMEQGFGDVLQFARYVPLLARRGATVIVRCDSSLVSLVTSIEGASEVVPFESQPAFDFHVWMLSLPLLFGTRMDTIPSNVPYLHADPQRVAKWQARIGSTGDYKVGLCWSGNPGNTDNVSRSISPALLAPLLTITGVKFFSLQKGAAQPQLPINDFTNNLHDWADTAALMLSLDRIITIDTGVLHLAGALGRPTWGMIPHVPDWRYFLDRDDSPWSPTMRLYRQSARGDWSSVIDRIKRDLTSEMTRRAKH